MIRVITAVGLALVASAAAAEDKYLGMPYSVIRERMIEVGYTPVRQSADACRKTRALGDYRCDVWPELELCNLEAPALCVADWRRPRGGVVKVVIHGISDPVYYASGEPR